MTRDRETNIFPFRYARLRDLSLISTGMYVQKCVFGPNASFDYAPPANFGWAPPSTVDVFINHLAVKGLNVRLGTSGYVAVSNGAWTLDVPLDAGTEAEPKTNELQFITVGNSPRPGLPLSQVEHVTVLRHTRAVGIVALLAFVAVRKRR